MLNSVYRDVITRKEEVLENLHGPKFDQIIQKARDNWVDYSPSKVRTGTAGVDSSFNSKKFQGLDLWAATAVAVRADGEILADLNRFDLGSDKEASGVASGLEIDACEQAVDRADLVLMDGSLHSQFMTRQPDLDRRILDIMNRRDNVIFISKTSNTKKRFEKMDSMAGDIFYYNHVTNEPGFSRIYPERGYGRGKQVYSTFARLGHSTPIIKLEFLKKAGDAEIRSVMDRLYDTSVGGYPYALKLAHNSCKISRRDLGKMTNLLGLGNEIGSREVLG